MDEHRSAALWRWMFDDALPFWATKGLDRINGGVIESFSLDAAGPSGVPLKRARVACRQLYVFSHAELLAPSPDWRTAADHVYADLTERFWLGEGAGWARTLTTQGEVLDTTPDLYDYAFALFALGWRYKVRRDPRALTLAHATLDLIESRFRHPGGVGFHAALPPTLPRQQNPHMHLMEAALALAEATSDARFARLADEIAHLFKSHLCRLPAGILPEFFDDAWRPAAGDQGRWVEPGHQFEWAWILAQHQKLTGADNVAAVKALVSWAERYGVDPQSQITFNRVRDDGIPLDRGARTWPNTERMKGWIGLAELTGVDPWPAIWGSADVLLNRYLQPAPLGCWIDSFDGDKRPTATAIPTSTLYHIFLAFAEAVRFANATRV